MNLLNKLKEVITSSIPLTLNLLVQVGIDITDIIMLSSISIYALAIVGLSTAIRVIFTLFAIGVLSYSMILFGKRSTLRYNVLVAGTFFILIFSLFLFPLSLIILHFLKIFGVDIALVNDTTSFLMIRLLGLPFFLFFILLKYYISTFYKTKIIFIISMLAIIINYIGNVLFIKFCSNAYSKILGISIASCLTDIIIFILAWLFCVIKEKNILSVLKNIAQNSKIKLYFKKLIVYGAPIGFTFVFEVGFFSIITVFMAKIGVNELAAYQITTQLTSITFMFTLGVSEAIIILVSKAQKNNDREEIIKLTKIGLIIALFLGLIFFNLFYFFSNEILYFFFDKEDLSYVVSHGLAIKFLLYCAFLQVIDSTQIMLNSTLKSLNDTFTPMVFYFISYFIIGLGSAYALGFVFDYGSQGLLYGVAGGVISIFLLLFIRLIRKLSKL